VSLPSETKYCIQSLLETGLNTFNSPIELIMNPENKAHNILTQYKLYQ